MSQAFDSSPVDTIPTGSDEDKYLNKVEHPMVYSNDLYSLRQQPLLSSLRAASTWMPWDPSPRPKMVGRPEVVYYCVRIPAFA
jgi:hypothetical protein